MNSIPIELQRQMVTNMSGAELLHLCTVNKEFFNLCKDEYLWRQLVWRDFNPEATQFCNSWYQTYKIYSTFNTVYVVSWRRSGDDWVLGTYMNPTDALCAIFDRIVGSSRYLMNGLQADVGISGYPEDLLTNPKYEASHPLKQRLINDVTNYYVDRMEYIGDISIIEIDEDENYRITPTPINFKLKPKILCHTLPIVSENNRFINKKNIISIK